MIDRLCFSIANNLGRIWLSISCALGVVFFGFRLTTDYFTRRAAMKVMEREVAHPIGRSFLLRQAEKILPLMYHCCNSASAVRFRMGPLHRWIKMERLVYLKCSDLARRRPAGDHLTL